MASTDDLAAWVNQLDDTERLAIAYWIDTRDDKLILLLSETSDNLRHFAEIVLGNSGF